jgi:hypothetical protein
MRLPSSLPHPLPSSRARRFRRLAASGLAWAALAIPFLAPAAASAAYGDIREVPAHGAIPDGWVYLRSEILEDGAEAWVLKDCRGEPETPPAAHLEEVRRSAERVLAEARVAGRPDEEIIRGTVELAARVQAEAAARPDHYSVLVGQRADFLAFHVIAEELGRLVPAILHPGPAAFRSPWMELERDRAELFQRFPSLRMGEPSAPAAATLLDPGSSAEGQSLSDLHPAVGTQVVSASLSLVTSHPQESCLFGFLRNTGMHNGQKGSRDAGPETHIRAMLRSAELADGTIRAHWTGLTTTPPSWTGLITQVFIPKARVRQFAYVSRPCGFVDHRRDRDIHAVFRERHAHDPLDQSQVRLLPGALRRDPEALVIRHSLIPEHAMAAYREKVRAILAGCLARGAAARSCAIQ